MKLDHARRSQVYCLVSFVVLMINYYCQPSSDGWVAGSGVAVIVTMWGWMLYAGLTRADRRNWPWGLLTAGAGCFATAGTINWIWQSIYGSYPFPGPADIFFLALYPLGGAGLILLVREYHDRNRWIELLSTGLLLTAVIGQAFTWQALWVPLARLHIPLQDKILTLSYPALDLSLLAVATAVYIAFRTDNWPTGQQSTELWLVIGGLAGLLTGDTAFTYASVRWNWSQPSWVDEFWFMWYLAWALASLEPNNASGEELYWLLSPTLDRISTTG